MLENKTFLIPCKAITQKCCYELLNKFADSFRNMKLKSYSGIISWHLHVKSESDNWMEFDQIQIFELKILNRLESDSWISVRIVEYLQYNTCIVFVEDDNENTEVISKVIYHNFGDKKFKRKN